MFNEIEQDENFHELGSAMNGTYANIVGLPYDLGHYYLYTPQQTGEEPYPAIVFLHGSAGNFKSYPWVWSKLAEAEGFVIIAPSYGFGNWDEDGITAVMHALEDAKQVVDIDEDQIYLAGLSSGGTGISLLAAKYPELFQGLIFISAIIPEDIVGNDSFHTAWANRPMLVVSGEEDQRISPPYLEQRIALLEAGDIDVSTVMYPNEDHFLLYSQPENLMETVAEWLDGRSAD